MCKRCYGDWDGEWGLGPGTMGFCATLCTVHTTQGQGQGTVFFSIVPVPVPVPVTCNVYEPLDTYALFPINIAPFPLTLKPTITVISLLT